MDEILVGFILFMVVVFYVVVTNFWVVLYTLIGILSVIGIFKVGVAVIKVLKEDRESKEYN